MDNINIPAAAPKMRLQTRQADLYAAFEHFFQQGQYVLGEQVALFEENFAQYIGASYCVGVNSGTDAISLSLLACGIQAGDEVITTSITAPATVVAILNSGATPVIVDVQAPSYCICPKAVEAAISSKTKVILPVHLHGYAAPMDQLIAIAQKYHLIIIEDVAQAQGTLFKNQKVGAFGTCGAFSFYPTKNLGALGDAGAVVTNDPHIAEKLYELRHYGFNKKGIIHNTGINSRLDELQAAFLNILLVDLDKNNQKRILYAQKYATALANYPAILPPNIEGATYHQFPIRVPQRDRFRTALAKQGIGTGIHYPYTLNEHPAFQSFCKALPKAQEVVKEWVSLPIQAEVLDLHFNKIISNIIKWLHRL